MDIEMLIAGELASGSGARIPIRDPFRDEVVGTVPDATPGEVETPNVTLSFWNPERDGEPFVANAAGIGLRVPDVPAAVEEARAAGAEVIGIEDTGVCHMGFVKDPDGNVLILHRRYAPRG